MTLRRGIEQRLRERYPGFRRVVAHEPEQLLQIEGLRRPVFEDAGSLEELAVGEMGLLSETFLRARNEAGARMALVVADAGTGKSRLIREFVDACDADAVVLRGRCLPYGEGITFWPLTEAVRVAAGIGADDSPEIGKAKVQALISDPEVSDRIAAVIGLSSKQFGVAEIFWATRKMLEQLAAVRTPVWVIVSSTM